MPTKSDQSLPCRLEVRALRKGSPPLRLRLVEPPLVVAEERQQVAGLVAAQSRVNAGEIGPRRRFQEPPQAYLCTYGIAPLLQERPFCEEQLGVVGIVAA